MKMSRIKSKKKTQKEENMKVKSKKKNEGEGHEMHCPKSEIRHKRYYYGFQTP